MNWMDLYFGQYALPELLVYLPLLGKRGFSSCTVLATMQPRPLDDYIAYAKLFVHEAERDHLVGHLIRSLISSVRHSHKAGYLHADLQSDNVLIESFELLLPCLVNFWGIAEAS